MAGVMPHHYVAARSAWYGCAPPAVLDMHVQHLVDGAMQMDTDSSGDITYEELERVTLYGSAPHAAPHAPPHAAPPTCSPTHMQPHVYMPDD